MAMRTIDSTRTGLTLFSDEGHYQTQKVLVAAAAADVDIERQDAPKDATELAALRASAAGGGVGPILQTARGVISGSNTAMRYLARLGDADLYGNGSFATAEMDQWMDYCRNELEPAAALLTYTKLGVDTGVAVSDVVTKKAKVDLSKALAALETALGEGQDTFLVGRALSIADIAIGCALWHVFSLVLNKKERGNVPFVTRYMCRLADTDAFASVFGAGAFTFPDGPATAPAQPGLPAPRSPNFGYVHGAGFTVGEVAAAAGGGSGSGGGGSDMTAQIKAQGDKVRDLKKAKAPKEEIDAAVQQLLALKEKAGLGGGGGKSKGKSKGKDKAKAAPAPPAAGGGGGSFANDPTPAAGLYVRSHSRIKDVLRTGEAGVGKTVTVKGWVKTAREQSKQLAFFELSDGSCFKGIQVVMTDKTTGIADALGAGGVGASLECTGEIVASPAKGQVVEMKCTTTKVLGANQDNKAYPLAKKRHTLEHLRELAHLRPRTNTLGAVMRVRNAMAYASHKFFNENGFYYIHTPLITASDCEGAGEMFQVTTLLDKVKEGKLPTTKDGKIDYKGDFFAKPAYMTVSGQLNVETHACALGDVYTFGPTFRAEVSHTSRHLAEFWMIEPEISFADLDADIQLAEAYLKYCVTYALEHCREDLEFFDKMIEKGLIKRLENVIAAPFAEVTYTEAIDLLNDPKTLKKAKFEEKPDWGIDLGSEHERYLSEVIFKKPTIITHYPKEIKAFYMKMDPEPVDLDGKYGGSKIGIANGRDGKRVSGETVAAMDIIVPRIGEIIGGSQREDSLEKLEAAVRANGDDPKDYWWYCDLRKYGSVPHAGFGLGFERLVMFVTGVENIRDTIPFPRVHKRCEF